MWTVKKNDQTGDIEFYYKKHATKYIPVPTGVGKGGSSQGWHTCDDYTNCPWLAFYPDDLSSTSKKKYGYDQGLEVVLKVVE